MRITGGKYKGRVLKGPDTNKIRPTSDKVRQAIFNMITHGSWRMEWGFDLEEARVLDLFCGTGTLALEALSHGAAFGYMVDNDDVALGIAKENTKICNAGDQVKFLKRDCTKLAKKPDTERRFQLVFLDPPYGEDLLLPALGALHEGGWLAPAALIIVEREHQPNLMLPACYQDIQTRNYGKTDIILLGYDPEVNAGQQSHA